MYDKNLSDIFNDKEYDKEKYPWAFNYEPNKDKSSKFFYVLGDSWFFRSFFPRVFLNTYKDFILINRSMGGMSNSLMINTLQSDIDLLTNAKLDVTFLVCFSEVGRSLNDLSYANPKKYDSLHKYFGDILIEQFQKVQNYVKEYPNYITTSFVSNNFNQNKSLVDFCGKTNLQKPANVYNVYSNGIIEFCKDRQELFDFNYHLDVEKSLALKNYLNSLQHIDDSLHPSTYKPYELFLENVFLNLQKKQIML
jgi:hypothetical protein